MASHTCAYKTTFFTPSSLPYQTEVVFHFTWTNKHIHSADGAIVQSNAGRGTLGTIQGQQGKGEVHTWQQDNECSIRLGPLISPPPSPTPLSLPSSPLPLLPSTTPLSLSSPLCCLARGSTLAR